MGSPSTFDEDSGAWVHAAAIASISDTADATYSANEQTMLDNLKTAVNSILTALRSANIVAGD